jgi:enoyl-CoA hydratase/carnithine racemase
MSEGKIVAVTDGATGWLIFSNPERLNAVSYEMWRAIPERVAEFVGDPAIRVVVLRGEGDKAFACPRRSPYWVIIRETQRSS